MKKDKIIYYTLIAVLFSLYCVAEKTGYDFLFLLLGLPVGCWVLWNLKPVEQNP